MTDKLRSYGVAHQELMPEAIHSAQHYENTRAEQSHEATQAGEPGMRKFKSVRQAQRFLKAHAAVSNLFTLVGIWLTPTIIEISGSVRSENGVGR